MTATRLYSNLSVAVLLASTVLASAKDKPAAKPEPTDTKTLVLRLGSVSAWKAGQQQDYFDISLVNKTKQLREVPELLADGNQLIQCPAITYVFRFENGLTAEFENGAGETWAPGAGPRRLPIALPAGGYITDKSKFYLMFWMNDEFSKYAGKGEKFAVTAICRDLKLKSNTLYINEYPIPEAGKEADPFKDADDYHARKRFEAANRRERAPMPRPVIVP